MVSDGGNEADTVLLSFPYSLSDITSITTSGANHVAIAHNGIVDEFTNYEFFTFEGGLTLSYADLINSQPTDIAIDGGNSDSVAENSANGTVVGVLSTVDPEAWQSHSYAITGGTGMGLFSIVGNEVRVNGALNFEGAQSYTLTVQSTDNGIPTTNFSETLTINLTDVNEGPNAGADFAVNAAESAVDATVLTTVAGTDPDTGGGTYAANNFENLTYVFAPSGNPSGKFEINGTTGEISLIAGQSLNFETANNHQVTVRVTDGQGVSDDVVVTINVTDINEQPSAGADFAVSVAENVNATTVLATVTGRTWISAAATMVPTPSRT